MTLDDDLQSAADELRHELTAITTPTFEPPSPNGRRVVTAAVGLLVVAGGWWGTRQLLDEPTPLDASGGSTVSTAPYSTTPEPTTADPVPGLPTASNEPAPADDEGAADAQGGEGQASDGTGSEAGSEGQGSEGVDSQAEIATSPMERPGSELVTEPDFGTRIRRVTDSRAQEVTMPVYGKTQVFNADGSLLLLYRTGVDSSGHVLYDGNELVEIGPLALDAFDIEDIYWDRTDPSLLRYVEAGTNRLIEVDVRTGASSVMHEFEGCDTVDTGDASGTTTSGSDLLAVICRRSGETEELIAFDLAEGVELARTAAGSAAPIAMRSGSGFVAVDDDGISVLGRDLQPTGPGRVYSGPVAGVVAAIDGGGRDVVVTTLFSDPDSNGLAVMFDLVTGERTDIVSDSTGWGYPIGSSGLSVAGGPNGSMLAATNWRMVGPGLLIDEVVLISLDEPSPSVRRLANHRMSESDTFGPWHRVNAVVSPDGAQVLFSSDWGTAVAVDTYVVELPAR